MLAEIQINKSKSKVYAMDEEYNVMVSLQANALVRVPIAQAASKPHQVPVDSDIVRTGRELGISFGDEKPED